MKILVNYEPSERNFLPQLAHFLKKAGLQAVSTSQTLEIGEMLSKAKGANCQAILLCNAKTLASCVPGNNPTLDEYRGSRLNFSLPVIVCNKLEHINTVNHGPWLLEQDLLKFRNIYSKIPPFTYKVLDTVSKFEQARKDLSQAIVIAYDIETDKAPSQDELDAPKSFITCCAWTGLMPNGELLTYVLPLVNFGQDHWLDDQEYIAALTLLRDINALPIPKAMQNGTYDAVHSIRYHAEPLYWIYDTMGMAHSTYSELPKTLDFIASYLLSDYRQWKHESEVAGKTRDINMYWRYNAQDTWYTMRILIEQLKTAPAYARKNYTAKFKLCYPCIYCAFEGWLIDNDERVRLANEAAATIEANRAELQVMMDDPNFNPGSWQQVSKYLYKVFGAKNPKIGKSASGTDEKNLTVVGQQHPLLAMLTTRILDYKKAVKAYGTYFTFPQYNGRLLYALNPFGPETERFSSQASAFWCGTQVQNIPSYAKRMLVADPGFEAAEIDNSQSEARCTAYLSQEVKLIEALETPDKDFYKTLGTLFFNIPYSEVTPWFRNKVLKKIVHGTNYMMGGKTFSENIGSEVLYKTAPQLGYTIVEIPKVNHPEQITFLGFSKLLLEKYHVPFPRVREWYKEVYREIATTGKMTSVLGHTRVFFGNIAKNHTMLRGAVAHGPQNLSVEILNKGFWNLYKHGTLKHPTKFRLKGQVHDSCKFQYPAEERDIWIPFALEQMTNPVEVHGRILNIPVEAEYGPNWKDKVQYAS